MAVLVQQEAAVVLLGAAVREGGPVAVQVVRGRVEDSVACRCRMRGGWLLPGTRGMGAPVSRGKNVG